MVSVIVPVYNAERFLLACLNSLLSQSYVNWEAILVDDGSKDSSPSLCDEYSRKDARVKVFHKENGGVSSARNLGLDKAVGDWVFFLDADDRMKADALSRMVEKTQGVDSVFGGFEVFDEQIQRTYSIDERVECQMDRSQALEQMFRPWHYRYYGYVWGKLFKKSLIDELGLRFDESIAFNEDRLFTVNYLCRVNKVAYFTAPVYDYMENSASAMASLTSSFNSKFMTDLDAFRKMKREVVRLPESDRLLPLLKHSAGDSFRRVSQMMREQHVRGIWPRMQLYAKMLPILSLREFWADAVIPLLYHKKRK